MPRRPYFRIVGRSERRRPGHLVRPPSLSGQSPPGYSALRPGRAGNRDDQHPVVCEMPAVPEFHIIGALVGTRTAPQCDDGEAR